MSKLKKALAKADENRGFDNRRLVGGSIKPVAPARLKSEQIEKAESKLDISYSKTKVQKVENNILAILIKNIGYHPSDKVPLVSINCDSLEFIIDDLYRLETEEIKNLLDTTPPDTLDFFDFRRLIIASIEKDCGLPTLEEHGERSVKVFWAFIQHNEKEQMAYYYRYIEGLVQSGDLHPERLVLVTDRLLVFNDYKQVYGSQIVNGELHPIENPDSVDYRRLEIGLEPLSEYLERFDLE